MRDRPFGRANALFFFEKIQPFGKGRDKLIIQERKQKRAYGIRPFGSYENNGVNSFLPFLCLFPEGWKSQKRIC